MLIASIIVFECTVNKSNAMVFGKNTHIYDKNSNVAMEIETTGK